MNLLKKEYDRFLDKARNHDFKSPDGIFINDSKLPKDTIFGLDKNNFLIIILPINNQISGFQIKDFIKLKDKTKFFVENENKEIIGSPLIFKRKNINDHLSLLSQINLILESGEYLILLSQYFDFLQKAHNSRNNFNSAAFFAEACTVLKLLKTLPHIANQWDSSANATIDIAPSEYNPAIEVKSTTNQFERIHTLSIHQIKYFQRNNNSLLASVVVFHDGEVSCKSICEKLLKELKPVDRGYKYIQGFLLAYADITSFSESCFDEGMTINSIRFYESRFDDLPLNNPPKWLVGGNLRISTESLKESNNF
jgi:hypothetical protein